MGNGTLTPTIATPVAVLTSAVAVAAGRWHSLAARADGTAWAWGENGSGRLGDGTTTRRVTPVPVDGLTTVVAVAAGYDHSLALKADGTVWAFGNNGTGQLGDGTTTTRTLPVQVLGLTGITNIAAGTGVSLAVQRDGAGGGYVWAWGNNTYGQLGDGSTLVRTVPVRVGTITTAAEAYAGQDFGGVLLADGTLRSWGRNHLGQLGVAAIGSSASPLAVSPLTALMSGDGGQDHAVASDADGRVWAWGSNASYFNMPSSSTPVLLPDAGPALAVSAGVSQTLLLHPDGTVWLTDDTGGGQGGPVSQIADLSLASNAWLVEDSDGDGLKNWQEYAAGTDPLRTDSNGNGLSDLVDVRRGSQSGNPDDDGDGVPNAIEAVNGTDPFLADTDGDGVADGVDDYALDATRSQKPAPNPSDTTPPVITLTQPTNARPVGGGQ